MSIACLELEIDTDRSWPPCLKSQISQFTSVFVVMGAFSCRLPIFVWVLTSTIVVVVIKMIIGCLFFMGAYYSDFMVILCYYFAAIDISIFCKEYTVSSR